MPRKRYWLKGLLPGIIIAIIPAAYFSYILFTWGGLPFSGYTAKTISDNPVSYLKLLFFFWVIFGFFLGLVSTTIGWIYEKENRNIKDWLIIGLIFIGLGVLTYSYLVGF